MEAPNKVGLFTTWYDELKSYGVTTPRRGPTPHLGVGAFLVTALVTSHFAAQLGDAFAILAAYGPHAYLVERLRIIDWKHGWLSNGGYLSFTGKLVEVPATLILWAAAICATDFCSMILQNFIRRKGQWVAVGFRLLGAVALALFAMHWYRQSAVVVFHPIPFSSVLGSVVLIWKAFVSTIRELGTN